MEPTRQGPARRRPIGGLAVRVGVLVLLVSALAVGCVVPPPEGGGNGKWVLLFTRAQGFVHDSITPATQMLTIRLHNRGYGVVAGSDLSLISADRLPAFKAVVFISTTGDVLDPPQQDALEAWVKAGGGWVGIHGAIDAEYGWDFYGQLAGARFKAHPAIQPATVKITDPAHPAEAGLPSSWSRTDEWYDFQANPRPNVHVLATLDESTYIGGSMGADHPIEWCDRIGAGQTFVTAMGHTSESWSDEPFLDHVVRGIDAATIPGSCPAS